MTALHLHDDEIEQAFLGVILTEPSKLDDVPWFDPLWFYSSVHARIFGIIEAEWRAGRAASAPFLAQYFQNDKDLEDAGGAQYIYDLADEVVSVSALKDYALHLQSLFARRSLLSLAGRIKVAATDPSPDMTPEKIFGGIEKYLLETKAVKRQEDSVSVSSSAIAAMEAARNPEACILSGIPGLDRILSGGFKKACLYVLAGRPGMGKTAMGLTLAVNIVKPKTKRGLFFSLEMPHEQLTQRIMSRFSGQAVHSNEVRDWAAVEAVMGEVSALPLEIDDAAGLSVMDITARTKRVMKLRGLDFIVVDYLGLVAPEDKRANKVHQVEEITQGLKNLAKNLGIPVILLCQLSRALEGREDKRPTLSDLRDSGAIEQDADAVIFIYREEYYLERGRPSAPVVMGARAREKQMAAQADLEAVRGGAELIVAKNRQGRLGGVSLKFEGGGQVFYE